MSIQHQLYQELDRLRNLGPLTDVPQRLVIDTRSGQLQCDLSVVESLGCAFQRLSLVTSQLESATIEELKSIGETLSQKLNYLMEPICPIEIDEEGCIVQLRSNPPQKNENGHCYYELLVRRDELSLCRFQKTPASIRQPVEAHVTKEVLLRLADDLISVIPC